MELQSLIADLFYPSEDDRPFDVIDWPADFRFAEFRPNGRSETIGLAAFFDPLRETSDAARFAALEQAMVENLSDLLVIRHVDGSAEVNVYVVGRTKDGRWAGVHTVSVET